LELNRHRPEIEYLNRRPDHIIRSQRWEVYVLKLLEYGPLASTFRDGHVCEEHAETDGRKDQLVHRYALQSGDSAAVLGDGEGAGEETEPLELDGGHEEAVGHEAGEAFEVEWGWGVGGCGDEGAEGGGFLFQIGELDGD
jgi:hypothetical protein